MDSVKEFCYEGSRKMCLQVEGLMFAEMADKISKCLPALRNDRADRRKLAMCKGKDNCRRVTSNTIVEGGLALIRSGDNSRIETRQRKIQIL